MALPLCSARPPGTPTLPPGPQGQQGLCPGEGAATCIHFVARVNGVVDFRRSWDGPPRGARSPWSAASPAPWRGRRQHLRQTLVPPPCAAVRSRRHSAHARGACLLPPALALSPRGCWPGTCVTGCLAPRAASPPRARPAFLRERPGSLSPSSLKSDALGSWGVIGLMAKCGFGWEGLGGHSQVTTVSIADLDGAANRVLSGGGQTPPSGALRCWRRGVAVLCWR